MSDRYVREIGRVEDMDGRPLVVGVDYDTVTIGVHCFTAGQIEEVAQFIVRATWEAAQQKARMDAEVVRTACAEPHTPDMRCFDCATDDEMAAAIPPPPGAPDA